MRINARNQLKGTISMNAVKELGLAVGGTA